jgi:hypothetical protein
VTCILIQRFPGDGTTVLRFLRLLSQYYQGLDALDPPPCYQRLLDSASALLMSGKPDVILPASVSESPKDLAKESSLVQVNLRLTAMQLSSIRQAVLNELDKTGGPDPGFSRADMVIAIIAHSLAQADVPPVDHLSMLVNVSTHISHPIIFFVHSFPAA